MPPHLSPFNFVSFTAFFGMVRRARDICSRAIQACWFFLRRLASSASVGLGGSSNHFPLPRTCADVARGKILIQPTTTWSESSVARPSPSARGGTGEIIYSQAGTRRTCGARAEKRRSYPPSQVKLSWLAYEKGIAYVRPMDGYRRRGKTLLPKPHMGGGKQ